MQINVMVQARRVERNSTGWGMFGTAEGGEAGESTVEGWLILHVKTLHKHQGGIQAFNGHAVSFFSSLQTWKPNTYMDYHNDAFQIVEASFLRCGWWRRGWYSIASSFRVSDGLFFNYMPPIDDVYACPRWRREVSPIVGSAWPFHVSAPSISTMGTLQYLKNRGACFKKRNDHDVHILDGGLWRFMCSPGTSVASM